MNSIIVGASMLIGSLWCIAAHGASFPCSSAESTAELLICADPYLSKLDDDHLKQLQAAAITSRDLSKLTDDDDAATAWRNQNCRDKACVTAWFRARADALQQSPPAVQQARSQGLSTRSSPPAVLKVKPGTAPMTCSDPKATLEIADAADHPGSLSDAAFARIWNQYQCGPLLADFTFVRKEAVEVPSGRFQMIVGRLVAPGSPRDTFYIRESDVSNPPR